MQNCNDTEKINEREQRKQEKRISPSFTVYLVQLIYMYNILFSVSQNCITKIMLTADPILGRKCNNKKKKKIWYGMNWNEKKIHNALDNKTILGLR